MSLVVRATIDAGTAQLARGQISREQLARASVAAELALACSSHNGEPRHVETAARMLARAGRSAADLECGVHWPSGEAASADEPGVADPPEPDGAPMVGVMAGRVLTTEGGPGTEWWSAAVDYALIGNVGTTDLAEVADTEGVADPADAKHGAHGVSRPTFK